MLRFILDHVALLENKLLSMGWSEALVKGITFLTILAIIVCSIWLVYQGVRVLLNKIVRSVSRNKKSVVGEIIIKRNIIKYACYFVLGIIVLKSIAFIFEDFPLWIPLLEKLLELFIVFLFMKIVVAIMWVVVDYQEQKVGVRTKSIKGLVQFMAIIVYFLGSIVLISIIVSKSPLVFIGGLSAISAVLMLVFKDSILGLVAGVQLSNNDMVRIGDWITMSKYNADGTVMDITLTTVKVQNFDLTITTIPTYNLITDSVTNWRGMQEAGGRRIQRSIYIDITTIHFCTEEMLLRFSKVDLLKNYIQEKNAEIKADNTQQGYETFENLNGRSLTNIGVFRKYVELYLKNHPRVSKLPGLTLLVRQQAADEVGMPIQIYCFLNTTDWLVYEEIQSDIFDHLLAAIPFFDLSVYERTAQVDNRWCK